MPKLLELCELPVFEAIDHVMPLDTVGGSAEYATLARSLGYSQFDAEAHPLGRWLQGNEVPVYPTDAIDRYLERRKEEAGWNRVSLVKHPLRSKDRETYGARKVYDRAVPIEVLRLAQAVDAKFGSDVRLFIHAVAEDKDPFLAVEHLKSAETFFIAHWDEPGFSIL